MVVVGLRVEERREEGMVIAGWHVEWEEEEELGRHSNRSSVV